MGPQPDPASYNWWARAENAPSSHLPTTCTPATPTEPGGTGDFALCSHVTGNPWSRGSKKPAFATLLPGLQENPFIVTDLRSKPSTCILGTKDRT